MDSGISEVGFAKVAVVSKKPKCRTLFAWEGVSNGIHMLDESDSYQTASNNMTKPNTNPRIPWSMTVWSGVPAKRDQATTYNYNY